MNICKTINNYVIFIIGDGMQENLDRIQTFFTCDLGIKKILYELQPQEEDRYNKEAVVEYSDKLYKGLKDIKFYFSKITDVYFNDEKKYCLNFLKALESELIHLGHDYDKLSFFYKKFFAEMSESLVNEVGNKCVGYYMFRGLSLTKAKTINELLHVMHQSLINNENILQSMPKLASKENNNNEEITLYGIPNLTSKRIFDDMSIDLDCGITDILSLNDRIIMMVRDRGHALSIEIQEENDKYYVNYFIPKICNVDMVNKLKGVKKVDDNSKYTVGIFETTKENLTDNLNTFISMVPTDADQKEELPINNNTQELKFWNPPTEEDVPKFHM